MRPTPASRSVGFAGSDSDEINDADVVSVIVEADDADALEQDIAGMAYTRNVERLSDSFLSVDVSPEGVEDLINEPRVERLQSKKVKVPHLTSATADVGISDPNNAQRLVAEDGRGVVIGIIDSGFDLSHPAFRDAAGNLRVDALLDQTAGNREFDTAALENAWAAGTGPGADENGHGTHVAGIAGGTNHQGFEGVAPGARFLLVKTDFLNTDRAARWVFNKAVDRPCVVNMSLGHHFGSHDGTEAEERLHRALTSNGARGGRVIVISAGNEHDDAIHIGGRFFSGQAHEVIFDVHRQQAEPPYATITLWYDQTDAFDVSLVNPAGQVIAQPALGNTDSYTSAVLDIEISRRSYSWSRTIQTQISLGFKSPATRNQDLRNWKLRLTCQTANVGRLDGWFNNSGYGSFRDHPLLESQRTVGLAATGDGCLAVASHVSRTEWNSDLGPEEDLQAVVGRISSFSSHGPTRDGRWKPDISAPGQYVTAALADGSELARWDQRALTPERLLTIEGTSMAAPVVAGVVALMLQKRPGLSLNEARRILSETVKRDAHTGPALWNPAYGYGKVDARAALARLP